MVRNLVFSCLLIVLIFSISGSPLAAQSPEFDSLRTLLDTTSSDTLRLRTQARLAFDLLDSNPAEALSMAQGGEKAASAMEWPKIRTRFIRIEVLSMQRMGDYTSAQEASIRGIELAESIGLKTELGNLWMELAISFMDQDLFDLAEENYIKAKTIFEKEEDSSSIPRVLHNLANLYDEQGDQDKAIEMYKQNLQIFTRQKFAFGLAVTHNNLGRIYEAKKQYKVAETNYLKAAKYKIQSKNQISLVNTYNNLGSLYAAMKRFPEARKYLEKSTEVARKVHSRKPAIETLKVWADFFHSMGRDDSAFYYLQNWVDRKDSIFNKETVERVAMLYTTFRKNSEETQIALLEKDQEIRKAEMEAQSADLERQDWFIAMLGIGLGLAFLLAVVLYNSNRRHRRALAMLKEKNLEIEEQKSEIEEQNKSLEDLNRETDGLINIVAHDLKAPLNRSTGLAQLIELTGPLTEEQKTYVKMIGKVNEAGSRLIQDLLDINHIEHPDSILEITPVNMQELLKSIYVGFESAAKKKDIRISLTSPSEKLKVETDGKFLERILDNLVSNALKFTEPGKSIFLSCVAKGEGVEIQVRDEGPGISAEDQKKMFKKFQRLSARPTAGESSSGLGLAIVRSLINKLEGTIALSSEEGKGTEFRVTIPNIVSNSPF